MQITAQYITAEYPFNLTELFPTAPTIKAVMKNTDITTMVVKRRSSRAELM